MKKRKKNKKVFVGMLVSGGVLLIVAALMLSFPNTSQPTEIPAIQESASDHDVYPEVERVDLPEAKAAFDAGSAVFLDVRASESYAEGRIPGALSIPLAELEQRLNEIDPEQWIITYCT